RRAPTRATPSSSPISPASPAPATCWRISPPTATATPWSTSATMTASPSRASALPRSRPTPRTSSTCNDVSALPSGAAQRARSPHGSRSQHPGNPVLLDLLHHGLDVLAAGAEMAVRVGQRQGFDPVEPVIFIVHQAMLADQRPQHQAQHALVVTVFRGRPEGEIAPHQFDDVDAAIGAPGPQAADHQFIMQHVVAHHMERL